MDQSERLSLLWSRARTAVKAPSPTLLTLFAGTGINCCDPWQAAALGQVGAKVYAASCQQNRA